MKSPGRDERRRGGKVPPRDRESEQQLFRTPASVTQRWPAWCYRRIEYLIEKGRRGTLARERAEGLLPPAWED